MNAFVLMPFDPEFSSIFEQLIKPALEEANYNVARADSFIDQQNILRDIIQGIAKADLIVADLTTLNANVFYELGLCHGLRIPTILLSQSIEEVPFDLRSYKIQIYDTRFDKIHKLKHALKDIGERHARGEVIFGSPITDFFNRSQNDLQIEPPHAALKIYTPGSIPNNDNDFDNDSDHNDKGLIDFIADMEEAFEDLTGILEKISKEVEEMGNKVAGYAGRIQATNNYSGPGKAKQLQGLFSLLATDTNLSAKNLEALAQEFEHRMNLINENFDGYIDRIQREGKEAKESVANSRETLTSLLEGAQSASDSYRSLRDTVVGLPEFSKEFNRSKKILRTALSRIIENVEKVEAFCARAVSLINQMFEEKDVIM